MIKTGGTIKGIRYNKYAGQCYLCGVMVPAGKGLIKKRKGKWVVYHSWCEDNEEFVDKR